MICCQTHEKPLFIKHRKLKLCFGKYLEPHYIPCFTLSVSLEKHVFLLNAPEMDSSQ
jgi:hypothetical protein